MTIASYGQYRISTSYTIPPRITRERMVKDGAEIAKWLGHVPQGTLREAVRQFVEKYPFERKLLLEALNEAKQ